MSELWCTSLLTVACSYRHVAKDWCVKVQAPESISITPVAVWHGLPHAKKCRSWENMQGVLLSLFHCALLTLSVSMTRPNSSSSEDEVAMAAPAAVAFKAKRL